jgi:hypothetical protein
MTIMTATRLGVLFAAVLACIVVSGTYAAEAPTESQVEAVFVFNFSRCAEDGFPDPTRVEIQRSAYAKFSWRYKVAPSCAGLPMTASPRC